MYFSNPFGKNIFKGWGLTGYNEWPGSPLRSLEMTVTQVFPASIKQQCKDFQLFRYIQVDKLWLYTSSVVDGVVTDACKGDSGGPLILEKGGQPLLIGVLEVTQ